MPADKVKNQEYQGEYSQAFLKYKDFNGNYLAYRDKLKRLHESIEEKEASSSPQSMVMLPIMREISEAYEVTIIIVLHCAFLIK